MSRRKTCNPYVYVGEVPYSYAISGYYRKKLSRINMLHECKLCSSSLPSEEAVVTVLYVCSMSYHQILVLIIWEK
jgi:hypothetical protein